MYVHTSPFPENIVWLDLCCEPACKRHMVVTRKHLGFEGFILTTYIYVCMYIYILYTTSRMGLYSFSLV